MTTLMLPQVLTSALETIINQALALNIHSNSQLETLAQQTLTITLSELDFPLSFSVNDNRVLVTTLAERADCEINTSIKTLLQLKKEQELTRLIKQELLDIQGDIKVAQQFSAVAANLEIDWQSQLAKYIGDIATYQVVQTGKNIWQKLTFAAEQIQADASEWLVHEKRMLVTTSELGVFNRQVSELAEETEFLTARIEALVKDKVTTVNSPIIPSN